MQEELRRMIVSARKKAGLSQSDLATRLSRPQSFVSKVERVSDGSMWLNFSKLSTRLAMIQWFFLEDGAILSRRGSTVKTSNFRIADNPGVT
jgi:hypothetical protein